MISDSRHYHSMANRLVSIPMTNVDFEKEEKTILEIGEMKESFKFEQLLDDFHGICH